MILFSRCHGNSWIQKGPASYHVIEAPSLNWKITNLCGTPFRAEEYISRIVVSLWRRITIGNITQTAAFRLQQLPSSKCAMDYAISKEVLVIKVCIL